MVYATKVCRSAQRKLFAQYQQKPFQRAFIDEPAENKNLQQLQQRLFVQMLEY